MSDVHVTRHFSLTGETFTPNLSQCEIQAQPEFFTFSAEDDQETPSIDELFPVRACPIDIKNPATWYPVPITKVQHIGFCDWLSIYQRHGSGLPKYHDGAVVRIDKHGETVCTTLKKFRIEGSHESAIFIRSDGDTVWFEGNVSKFGRLDNVFGYTFRECLLRINNILFDKGLPPFTEGERFISNFKGSPRSVWTGAMVTRVDVTENHATGSKENAYYFMRFLAGQQAQRLKTGTHGEGETVDWGRGSRRVYSKAYLKGPELRTQYRKHGIECQYSQALVEWCDAVGLVRFETTYKATKLHDMCCHYLGGFDMRQIENDFTERKEVLSRSSVEVEQLTELPKHLLSTYRMWQAGDDITEKLSRASMYKHRRALLPYGIDIAVKSNVTQLKPRTRVITLGPVSPPSFYDLPTIERKRYGNHG